MAKAKNLEKPQATTDPNQLQITAAPDETQKQTLSRIAHDPAVRAVMGGRKFHDNLHGTPDITSCLKTLVSRIREVEDGKMGGIEATLLAQADTLDLVFNSLLRRAAHQEMLPQYETFMRLALKAQSQCRTTLETLAEIKNPKPTAFIKQQNMAAVQQVNNTLAQEKKYRPNELLEGGEVAERVDTGTETQAIEAHSRLEALEEIQRSKNSGREEEILAKRLQGK